MKQSLSCFTVNRARWLRDLCYRCPHDAALRADITKNDCMAIAEALDFAVRMSARAWKQTKKEVAK